MELDIPSKPVDIVNEGFFMERRPKSQQLIQCMYITLIIPIALDCISVTMQATSP